ncbi:MAG: hypothetical protein KIH80_001895, partial [Flavobacteriia bacterium]|nr:hypothetical protein [Flavobacteriia bacterium]
TYSITIGALSNTNYNIAFTSEDFEINQKPITITADAKTKVYGALDPSLTYTLTAGSIVSGDNVSGVLTRTSGEIAGTYSITQNSLTYGTNYLETYVSNDLSITNATVTLTVSDYTKVYDKAFINSSHLSFTATGLVNGDTISDLVGTPTYTVAGTATNTVGTYSISLSGLSHPSYDLVSVGANARITPMSLSPTPTVVTFNSVGNTTWVAPANVNQVNYLVVGGGGGGGNGYDNAAGGGGGGGMVLLGELYITTGETYNISVGAGGNGGANIRSNRNGTAGSNSVFGTITALGGGAGLGSRSGGSAGQAQVGSLTAPTGGGGNGGGRDGDGGGGAGGSSSDLAGSSPGVGGVGIISNISGVSATYGIGGNGGYNGGPFNGANGSINSGNGGAGGSSPSSNSASGGNGGSGIVILTYTDIEVEPISDIRYTGNAITPSPTLRFNGNILNEGRDYTTSFTGNTNVGTASITLTGIGNFNGEKTIGFNITSKTLTITAENKNKVYNSSVYTPTDYTITYEGFVGGQDKYVLSGTLTYTGTALTATESGTYVITPGGLTSSNYNLVYESGTLSITQKPITITITDRSKIYGSADPSLDHTITIGSVYGQTPSGSLTRTVGEDVGSYTISKSDLTYGSNYIETFVNGTLSITTRTITVTAAAKTKVFGETDPELTYTATPEVGDPVVTGSSATVTFTGSLARDAGDNAGTYSITIGTLTNTNYNINYVGANFTITKAPTSIEDGDSDPATQTLSDTTVTFGDADLSLTPTSSNTADYTFTSSDSSVASITTTSTNTAEIRNKAVGSAVITIEQASDDNYQGKTISYTLTVCLLYTS